MVQLVMRGVQAGRYAARGGRGVLGRTRWGAPRSKGAANVPLQPLWAVNAAGAAAPGRFTVTNHARNEANANAYKPVRERTVSAGYRQKEQKPPQASRYLQNPTAA